MNELQVISKKIVDLPGRPLFMLDKDVAELYETETKRINEAVKRNPERFPEDFYFQLTEEDLQKLVVADCDLKFENWGGPRYLPYAFAREGCNMLSAVLNTPIAIARSIQIIRAFSALERFAGNGAKDSPPSPLLPNGWQMHELRLIYGVEGAKAILRDSWGIDPYKPKSGISYYEEQVINKNNRDKGARDYLIAELRDRGVMLTEVARVSGLSMTMVSEIHKRHGGKGQRYPWKDPSLNN